MSFLCQQSVNIPFTLSVAVADLILARAATIKKINKLHNNFSSLNAFPYFHCQSSTLVGEAGHTQCSTRTSQYAELVRKEWRQNKGNKEDFAHIGRKVDSLKCELCFELITKVRSGQL